MKSFFLLVAALVALGGCSGSESHAREQGGLQQDQVVSKNGVTVSADLELGRRIYNFRCYYCHGYSGNARTLAATLLDPKPLDFTSTSPDSLGRKRMMESIKAGRPGTAMMSFASTLQPQEIAAVTDFIRQEFMVAKAENTRYHTAANGWPNHERYAAAFPFATGKIALDTPWEKLTPEQANGKRLFMTSCVTCHDRELVNRKQVSWESRPVSYPGQYSRGDNSSSATESYTDDNPSGDAATGANPYLVHDRPPRLSGLTETEKRGEILFQKNCASCHAADGTARNWIGSFIEPHPGDLTKSSVMNGMTRTRLKNVIRDGLVGTSMPAWKSVLSNQQVEDIIAYVGRAFHSLAPEP